MEEYSSGATHEGSESTADSEFGVVRLSLGLASNFSDVYRVLRFVRGVIACDSERKKFLSEWKSHAANPHLRP